jgi:hypothetical protein
MRLAKPVLRWSLLAGRRQLTGIAGRLRRTIDEDGTHHYELEYDLFRRTELLQT